MRKRNGSPHTIVSARCSRKGSNNGRGGVSATAADMVHHSNRLVRAALRTSGYQILSVAVDSAGYWPVSFALARNLKSTDWFLPARGLACTCRLRLKIQATQ